jgi:hypothetical protein
MLQSQGNRFLQPQQPAFYPQQMFHPIMYSDNDTLMPPQFVRVVAPGDYTGLMAHHPQQMWIKQAAPVPYSQVIMPAPVLRVDRGSDAGQWPKCAVKSTQTCSEDLQTKADSPMEIASSSGEKWDLPDVKSGEILHGWDDTPSPEKKKSRNEEKRRVSKIDTLHQPEISAVAGNKDKTVSKRVKSRSPAKHGKSRSSSKDQPVPQEKVSRVKMVKDIGDNSFCTFVKLIVYKVFLFCAC